MTKAQCEKYLETVKLFEHYLNNHNRREGKKIRNEYIRLTDYFYLLKNKKFAIIITNCANRDRLDIYCGDTAFWFEKCDLYGKNTIKYLVKILEKFLGVPYLYSNILYN